VVALIICTVPFTETRAQTEKDAGEDGWDGFRSKVEELWYRIPHEERDIPWLVGDFNWASGLVSAAFVSVAVATVAGDSRIEGLEVGLSDVGSLGDDIFKAIPGAAYVTSAAARDWHGLILMGTHNIVSSGIMQFGKDEVGQRRPHDATDTSFPSGHANTAFIGAAYLQQRYGPMWGIPAYIAASYVAFSRVYSNQHYAGDVITGASIAMASAWSIVPPYESDRRARWADLERDRLWRYEWEMTLSDVPQNQLQAPSGSGDVFTNPLLASDEPWATAHIGLEYKFANRNYAMGIFSPWEIRSYGEFTAPTTIGGVTLPANQQLRSRHLNYHFLTRYRYQLVDTERFDALVGAGVTAMYTKSEIFVVDDTNQPERRGLTAEADVTTFYGVAHASLRFNPFWKLHLVAEGDYGNGGGSSYSEWTARLDLKFSQKWVVGIGYREFESDIDESELRNKFRRHGTAISFSYSF
jgi:membrane-associated phospholipid phosphatase